MHQGLEIERHPNTSTIEAQSSLLLLIDVQAKLLPSMREPDLIVNNTGRLATAAKRIGIPVVVTEQYPRGLGPTISDLTSKLPETTRIFEKVHFSALRDPAISSHFLQIRETGVDQIIVAGLEAHVCVLQTCLDLNRYGFTVFLVTDGTGSRSDENKRIAISRMQGAGVVPAATEMVLFEWIRQAGTPLFKDLLSLIK